MEWIAVLVASAALYLVRDLDRRFRRIEARLDLDRRSDPDADAPARAGLQTGPEDRPQAGPQAGRQAGSATSAATTSGAPGVADTWSETGSSRSHGMPEGGGVAVPPPPPPRASGALGVGESQASRDPAGSPVSTSPEAGPAGAVRRHGRQSAVDTGAARSVVRRAEFESFLGGRVLLVAGVVVVLLGIGFFLHQAIQSGAIGPGMRTILTGFAGLAALVGGEVLRRRSLDVFAAGLSGAGIGALFLATHFAANVHHFVGRPTGFLLAAAITAGGVVLGVMRESPFLTHLGFLGGWFAPALFGSPSDSVWPLAGWLLLLDAGVLAIRCRLSYAGLDLLAAFAASTYLILFVTNRHLAVLTPTVLAWFALSLSRVAIAVIPPWFLRAPPPWKALAAAVIGAIATLLVGTKLLFEDHRLGLGFAILPLAAIYFAAAYVSRRRLPDPERAARGYAAIAIMLVASVIPMLFPEVARAPVYAAAAVALFVIGADARRVIPRLGGYAYLLFAVSNAFEYYWPLHDEPFRVFLNAPFVTHLFPAVAILASGRILARAARESEGAAMSALGTAALAWLLGWEISSLVDLGDYAFLGVEREAVFAAAGWTVVGVGWIAQRIWQRVAADLAPVGAALCVVGAVCALPAVDGGARVGDPLLWNPGVVVGLGVAVALAGSAWLARGRTRGVMSAALALWIVVVLTLDAKSLGQTGALLEMQREELRFLSQVILSVAWAANGAAWTWLGFRWRRQRARFAGMGLLGITAAKVFLADLAGLDTAWRAGSFLGLGVLLLAVSYLYHRAGRGASPLQEDVG